MGDNKELDRLNCVYEMIHDLYHFGMLNNYFEKQHCGVLNVCKVDSVVEWMHDNLDTDAFEVMLSYFNYLPPMHGNPSKACGDKYKLNRNRLSNMTNFSFRSKRRMIVPFKYMKKINGMYPLESVYNDKLFTYGATEDLLSSYKMFCEAYRRSEYEYIEKYPDEEVRLLNYSGTYNTGEQLHIKNDIALLRTLCWWDVYGRFTGKTTDLNYIDVCCVEDFSYAFSSTSRFLSDVESEDKTGIFRMLNNTTWKYDISSWKPSSIVTMVGMFRYNKHIPECIKDWDVSKVTDMSGMFKSASGIPDISGWNVSNVKNMYEMFDSAKGIPDISGWDISNVTDMRDMFANVGYIPDISRWKTKSLQLAASMFERASVNVDLSELDVSSVVDFSNMFNGAVFRIDTDFTNWNMRNANILSGMFKYSRGHLWVSDDDEGCYGHGIFGMVRSSNIVVMDVAAWDVSNVRFMNEMFLGSDLSADLSKWNVSKVEFAEDFDSECDCPHKIPNFNEGCYV